MIKTINGGQVTGLSQDEALVPVVALDNLGSYSVAGRHNFRFELVSGSIQMCVGVPVSRAVADGLPVTNRSTAGQKWEIIAAPENKDGGNRNIYILGTGIFNITW